MGRLNPARLRALLDRPDVLDERRKTWRLAFPVVLTQVANMAMGVVDTLMAGHLGEVELGAVGIGNALFITIGLGAAGVLMALDAIVGRLFGAGERARCGHALWQGYWIAAVLGPLLTLPFLDAGGVLRLLGQTEPVVAAATDYLAGRAWSMTPFVLYAAMRGFLSGVGNTRILFAISIVANVVNVAATGVLVFGWLGLPALGVAGIGWATTVATTLMIAHGVAVIHTGAYREYFATSRRPDRAVLHEIATLGVPFGLHLAAEVGSFSALAVFAGWLGEAALGAHQVVMTLAALTFMVPLGISAAASVRVAQSLGQRDPARAALAGRISLVMGTGFMALAGLAFLLIPGPLVRLFTSSPAVIDIGTTVLRVAGLFQVSDGLQVIAAGCLRGTGDTRTAFVANLGLHWAVGIPLGCLLAFPLGFGAAGLWAGTTFGLTLIALVLCRRFLWGRGRPRLDVVGSEP